MGKIDMSTLRNIQKLYELSFNALYLRLFIMNFFLCAYLLYNNTASA